MEVDYSKIKVIGFDADDTLWVNETYFRDTEAKFAQMLSKYETPNAVDQELFKMEMKNLPIYGYGIKGFMLSMVESAIELSGGRVNPEEINQIIRWGKEMLDHPVELLAGIPEALKALSGSYRLIVLTKGDLLDQERKIEKSGLGTYFHHVEVLSDKKPSNYLELLTHLNIPPQEFLMIGNSLKSDVLPLIEIGAQAVHVPFHTTWAHEQITTDKTSDFLTLNHINELLPYLKK
ncbi:MAG: HAD family hydrolase [Flavobacteriaceae bacterium]|jgi:putative hydrolase of the HAD superfamily|nr:HAD family hydrolase [Flavobacteriaceae bacterium]